MMIRVLDFWLDLEVDEFRLDAVPCLYERKETSCEGFPNPPRLSGGVDFVARGGTGLPIAIATEPIPGMVDARSAVLDALGQYYDQVGALDAKAQQPPPPLRLEIPLRSILRLLGESI